MRGRCMKELKELKSLNLKIQEAYEGIKRIKIFEFENTRSEVKNVITMTIDTNLANKFRCEYFNMLSWN